MGTISEATFIRAYDEHADGIFRFCAYRLGDRERAKDITQDAFMRTWSYIAAGNRIDNLKAFLYRTARNLTVNERVRSSSVSLDILHEQSGYDPEDHALPLPDAQAEARILSEHLDTLEPPFREVLVLRYMNGLAVKEIATILDEEPNTISVRIHRALAHLRTRMHVS